MSILTFIAVFVLTCRLLPTTLPFFSRVFYKQKRDFDNFSAVSIFLAKDINVKLLLKAAYLSTSCQIVIAKGEETKVPLSLRIAPNVLFIAGNLSLEEALKKTKEGLLEGNKAYLFHEDALSIGQLSTKKSLFSFQREDVGLISLEVSDQKSILHVKKYSVVL